MRATATVNGYVWATLSAEEIRKLEKEPITGDMVISSYDRKLDDSRTRTAKVKIELSPDYKGHLSLSHIPPDRGIHEAESVSITLSPGAYEQLTKELKVSNQGKPSLIDTLIDIFEENFD